MLILCLYDDTPLGRGLEVLSLWIRCPCFPKESLDP